MNKNDLTLSELREIHSVYIQQAIDEEVPQKAAKIALLGPAYVSDHHGVYNMFPVLYGNLTAVFTKKDFNGKFISHGKWEQCTRVLVTITKRFDPTVLNKYENIPEFWVGDSVLRWTLSDIRTEPLETDLFVPGKWWDKAQDYLPKAEEQILSAIKSSQEEERKRLYKKLLIGINI